MAPGMPSWSSAVPGDGFWGRGAPARHPGVVSAPWASYWGRDGGDARHPSRVVSRVRERGASRARGSDLERGGSRSSSRQSASRQCRGGEPVPTIASDAVPGIAELQLGRCRWRGRPLSRSLPLHLGSGRGSSGTRPRIRPPPTIPPRSSVPHGRGGVGNGRWCRDCGPRSRARAFLP